MEMWMRACVASKMRNVTRRVHYVFQLGMVWLGSMTMGHLSGDVRAPTSLGKTRNASPLLIVRYLSLRVRISEHALE